MPEESRRSRPLARRKSPTGSDVARLAGCSQPAVSLWLNGQHEKRLSPELIDRIARAAAQLGYVPNRAAQRLSGERVRSVSMLFPGYTYDFLSTLLEGTTETIGDEWEFSLFDTWLYRDQQSATRLLSSAVGADTWGVVLAGPSADELSAVSNLRTPLVVVDSTEAPPGASLVAFDLDRSLDRAVADLAARGHRRIGYASYYADTVSLGGRRPQVERALARHGIDLVPSELVLMNFDIEASAGEFVRRIPIWQAASVTAILCAHDRHAYGAMVACRNLGVIIPDHMSLITFSDSTATALLQPALSAVHLPSLTLGVTAGHVLLEHIMTGVPIRTLVETRWHPRASIGPPWLS